MINNQKYIKTVPFSKLFNWSVQYLSESKISFNTAYPMVCIGEFLIRNKTKITIQDATIYKRVTIKVRNGGVILRNKEIGKNIRTKKQYLVSDGQFILSKIDARNGAMGIIPTELDGAIVTQDFLPYDMDLLKINPKYLVLVSTTKAFVEFCQACSSGTTNRQRIEEIKFLDIKIPLPSLDEQNELVDYYNTQMTLAAEQENLALALQADIKKYLTNKLCITRKTSEENKLNILQTISFSEVYKWSISDMFKDISYSFKESHYDVVQMGHHISFFEGGKTPSTAIKEYWDNGDVFWTSAKDMKELYLSNITDKITKNGASKSGLKIYPPGTLLCVFRSGILRHSFPICLTLVPTTINQDLKAIGVNEEKITKVYFLLYLNTLQDLVLERSQKKGATVESLSTEDFMLLPIVTPPIEVQNEIVEHINGLKEQIKILRTQATENRNYALKTFEQKIF